MGRKKQTGGETPGVQFRLPADTLATLDAVAASLATYDGSKPNRTAAVRFGAVLLRKVGTPVPVVGTIAAGTDDCPTVHDDPEFVTFWEAFPRGSFALEVTGGSCSKWGICHGDTVVMAPSRDAHEGRFHALRTSGGAHALKAYSGGKWWQFGEKDGEPTEYHFDGSTNTFGVLVGGRYGDRAYRPDTPAKKPRRK